MKLDTNMLLLLAAGGVGLYFLMQRRQAAPAGGLSPTDMAILQQLSDMQSAAAANQTAMMKIIEDAKKSGDPKKMSNPWTHPDTIVKFAELGIQIAGMFV